MNARLAALLLAGMAAVVYLTVARPLRDRAGAYADAFGAARVERQEAASRLSELQRRNQARARAIAAVKGAVGDPAGTTRAVRQSVAQAVAGSPAAGLNLTIRPSDAGVDVNVTGRGSAIEVLDLTGRLARPESGVVLERVTFTRADSRVALQVTGQGIAETK